MKKHLPLNFKTIWLFVHFLLFILPVFAILIAGSIESLYLSCIISFLFSMPTIFLFNFILDFFGPTYLDSILFLYSCLIVCSVAGYLQWFVLVPRLIKYVKESLIKKDLQIVLNTNVINTRELPAAETDFVDADWQKFSFDEKQKSPVERLFDHKND